MNDIDLAEYGDWTPLDVTFSGVLDGNGYPIKNMKITPVKVAGLIKELDGAVIKNLSIIGDIATEAVERRYS